MRLHVVWLPHTVTSKEYSSCAYTQKVLNFCKMMKDVGYTVYHYWGEWSVVDCDEHITVVDAGARKFWFGERELNKFPNIVFDPTLPYWIQANDNTIDAMKKRLQNKDIICVIGGRCHQPIAQAFPHHMTVEFWVGYNGTFAKYKVFESYAHMHYVYWEQHIYDWQYYDTVIPNYFDENDFVMAQKKKNYFLYIGRLIPRKGVDIAVEATKAAGVKLKIAGQWVERVEGNKIICKDMILEGDHIEYVWEVGVQQRAKLMAEAKGVLVPTSYLEPFGGVAVEAMMCWTPVITSDWGAFPETVVHGKTWYRCRTLEQYIWAIKNVKHIRPANCNRWASCNYSLDTVKLMYKEYFERLQWLRWDWRYSLNPERENMEFLEKLYYFD